MPLEVPDRPSKGLEAAQTVQQDPESILKKHYLGKCWIIQLRLSQSQLRSVYIVSTRLPTPNCARTWIKIVSHSPNHNRCEVQSSKVLLALASQQTRGILHRPRFLFKSHITVRNVNSVYFGCLFCDKTKSTLQEDDATVFQSVDLLFRHISRHGHPLPPVPGVEVVYEHSDVNSRGRQDCDLYIPNSTMTALHGVPRANESNRIASLPAARAVKDHIRRSNERPQARPDATSEILQFLSGAKIIGIEFPEKWDGKWCQGWHDGVFGTFPSKLISLDMPRHVKIASLPNTPRTGVARWKFEKQRQPGWLVLKKGDIIYNLACGFSIISNLTWIDTYTIYRGGSTRVVLEWLKCQERVWNISKVSCLNRVYQGRVPW